MGLFNQLTRRKGVITHISIDEAHSLCRRGQRLLNSVVPTPSERIVLTLPYYNQAQSSLGNPLERDSLFGSAYGGRCTVTPMPAELVYHKFCRRDNGVLNEIPQTDILLSRCFFYSPEKGFGESPFWVRDVANHT